MNNLNLDNFYEIGIRFIHQDMLQQLILFKVTFEYVNWYISHMY